MGKNKKNRCTKCGSKTPPFTIFADIASGKSQSLCINCISSLGIDQQNNLKELDKQIEQAEAALAEMEKIAQELGDIEMDVPKELSAFMITPIQAYKMAQMGLANLKTQRLKLITRGENIAHLQYEQERLVQEENYEAAAIIHKKIKKLQGEKDTKKKSAKKKSTSKKSPSKRRLPYTGENCPNCEVQLCNPLTPLAFGELDLGEYEKFCFGCLNKHLPDSVQTIEQCDSIIAILEQYISFTSLLSGLLGLEGRRKEKGAAVTEVIDAPKQLLVALKKRKQLLT